MNKNRVLIFTFVFGILAIFSYFATKEYKPAPKKIEAVLKNKNNINKIEVIKNGTIFEFIKENAKWYLNQPEKYPADSDVVSNIIDILGRIELKDILTTSEKDYSRLNVDSANGIKVRVFENSNLNSEVFIGKPSSDYRSCYVRKDKSVYIVKDLLEYYFTLDLDKIKDKKILDFDSKNIQEIKISRNNRLEQYTLKENGWINKENVQINPDDFINLLQSSKVFKFRKEEEIKSDIAESNIGMKVELKYKDGENDTVYISKIKRDNISAASSYNNIFFDLTQQTVDALTSASIKVIDIKTTSGSIQKP